MSVRLFQISNKLPVTGIVDKITQEKICTASTDKKKHRELILNNFVRNPNVSTLDLLKDGQAFKQFKWHTCDFKGTSSNLPCQKESDKGPHEDKAIQLQNLLNQIILEDRVNQGPNAGPDMTTYKNLQPNDKKKYVVYFNSQIENILEDKPFKLNKHALKSFRDMLKVAKAEKIEIAPFAVGETTIRMFKEQRIKVVQVLI